MNQGKLEVVKQEMARMNIHILGISEGKWTGMGEFNSDDHHIYYCGQESLRRNGVAIIVNKSLKCSTRKLQQYMNCELLDVQVGFRKGRETRDQIANIHWIIEKAKEFQKNTYFYFTDYAKTFDCGSQHTGKFWKRWEYQITCPASWEICTQVKKQLLELDMKQQTGSK